VVGADAELVTEADALVVRADGGLLWLRCLRCDAWLPTAAPEHHGDIRVPPREEIVVPPRGPILRDQYILRLIALDRALHVVVLLLLAAVLFTFARHDAALHRYYTSIMNALAGGGSAAVRVRGLLGYLGKAFQYSPRHLITLGLIVTAFAGVEAAEAIGLWRGRRWAEYLTFLVTCAFVPYEIYELSIKFSVFKLLTFIVNLAIVVYLLWAKRLFGLRGGYAAEKERRHALGGWEAIEHATVRVAGVADPSLSPR